VTVDAIVLCRQSGRATPTVDEMYADEAAAAREADFPTHLIDHDAACAGNFERAVRGVPVGGEGKRFLYRGWMLTVSAYRGLVEALETRGWTAITSAAEFEARHHLVGWVRQLGHLTPRSEWIPHLPPYDAGEIAELLQRFTGPVIVKDYVKSEKHAWNEACFIPDARDLSAATRVVERFLELRGESFEGGLVLREFVKLAPIGLDPRSGMPLSRELRTFWSGTRCLAVSDYWRNEAPDAMPQIASEAARRMNSSFYTIDLALTQTDEWIVMEVGDGQVSALPDALSPAEFYSALRLL